MSGSAPDLPRERRPEVPPGQSGHGKKTPPKQDDLRHAHAAVAVNGGEGLRVVAGLLGHADIATTFGYAHLAERSVFDAANRVSRGLADMLADGEADHD